jgi:hypothetical protein
LTEVTNKSNSLANKRGPITPVPSSDAAEPRSSQENLSTIVKVVNQFLPSPLTPAERLVKQVSAPRKRAPAVPSSSPTRKVCFCTHLHVLYPPMLTMSPGSKSSQLCRIRR